MIRKKRAGDNGLAHKEYVERLPSHKFAVSSLTSAVTVTVTVNKPPQYNEIGARSDRNAYRAHTELI